MTPVTFYATFAACAGRGRKLYAADGYRAEVCPVCHGLGSVLTEDGKSIFSLVRAAGVEGLLPGDGH